MNNDNLRSLRQTLINSGYNPPAYDDFAKDMEDENNLKGVYETLKNEGYTPPEYDEFKRDMGWAEPSKPYNPSEDTMGAGVGAAIGNAIANPQPQQTQPEHQPMAQPAAQQTQTPLTWQEQMAMNMGANSALGTAQNAIQGQRIKNIEEYQQKRTKQQPKIGQVANVVKSDRGTYLTEYGGEFSQLSDANQVQGSVNEANREKSVDEQLQNALAERDRLNDEMRKEQEKSSKDQWVDADGRIHYGGRGGDETMNSLMAAYRQNEDRIKTLTYEKDDAGFWQHMGTELGDLSSWNPLNSVDDASALLRAKQKIDAGQPLGESDRLLLANTLLSQEAHSKYDQNRNAWFRAGGIAAESVRLMPDFVVGMGPMKGIATGVAKGTGKVVAKTVGKKVAENVAGKILTKAAGVGAGTLAAGGALVNTVQLPRLASETLGNMTGELTLDEQGKYKFEGGDNLLNSVLKAEQTLIPEAASEVAGEFLPGAGTILEKVGLKKIANGLSRLQGTNWYKNYSRALAQTGFHGAPGEMIEEYLGDVYSAVLGDISGIAGDENGKGGWGDLDKHIDIALGTATLGALLHAPSLANTGRHGAQYYYYRHNVNKADKTARDVMGDEAWNTFKGSIDNTTNENISDVVNGMMRDPNLSTEQKQAIFDYSINLQKQRGHLLAIMAENKEEKDENGRAADVLDNSYAAGYEAEGAEEKQSISQNLDAATQNLDAQGEGFANWVKDESNPPMATLSYMMAHRDTYTDEQISAAADYYQSKYAAEGMQQAEADKSELEGEQSAKPLYTTMEQVDGKFTVSSYDKDGNLLEQQAFDTEDEAQAYRGEVRMRKQHQDFADLWNNPRVDAAALINLEMSLGLDEGTIQGLVISDPMRLSDAEWDIMEQAMSVMQQSVYPATEVHTEFNGQVGSEAADDAQIDTDMPNEQIVSSVVAPYIEARDQLNALFNKDEELAEEVQYYENMGKSEQEIISLISNFNPQEVQTVIDFYNAQARFEGFMNRSQEKIEERVRQERERRTFKGTINGQPDQQNLIEITDGSDTYTLVNGNISTDSEGRVTGSDSGMIIAIDKNGDFVSLGDKSISILPEQTTIDMWEQAFREQTQVNATAAIDPTGQLIQQPTEQSGNQDNAGGEASANNGTGANEPSATAPSVEEQQPSVPIESVVDKDGVKRYENGIPVDEAIADMQADGLNPNEEADLAINEAQAELSKIKQPKTRAERVKNAQKVQDLQRTIDYYNSVKQRLAEINPQNNLNNQPQQTKVEEKPVSSQSNQTVEEQKLQRIVDAKAKYGELFDDDFTKANDVNELVSMWVGRKRNLAWDDVNGKRGLQKELGWTRKIGGDTKYIETLLAKNGEGMGVDEFAHMVWESPENAIGEEKRWTTEEIKEALLDLLKSAQSKSDVVDYALNTRILAAEQALQGQQQMEKEMQEAGEVIEDTAPIDIDWNNMPFAPATQAEIAEADSWFETSNNTVYDERTESGNDELADEYMPASGGEVSGVQEGEGNLGQEQPDVSGAVEGNQVEEPSETRGGEADNVRGSEGSLDAGSRTDRAASEVQGQVDEYLQPRNAEEEKIIANVLSQLQQEISEAAEDVNKANAELQRARAKESDRATDMFANDETFAEPDAIFSQEEMGLDTSAEGVERRTQEQREKVQAAQNKLNQLQSLVERNSRVRGALDNYRRQTSIEDIDERQKKEYDEYIKPLLRMSDEQLQQMAKKKEDAVGGDLNQLNGDKEYSAIKNVLVQREIDRRREGIKKFIENTIDDGDVTFVDKATWREQDELNRLIDEYGVDDSEGKIEDYVKRLRKKYPVDKKKVTANPNPIQAIEEAANQFKQEQEEKKAYGADNKLVSQDRYEELKKRMREKLRGQLNVGVDPEMMAIGAEMAMYHIEAGARKFAEYATRMILDLGDAIRPYLKAFYEAARRMPGMEELSKEMDTTNAVDNFDILNYDKQPTNTVNEHKQENNVTENVVSSQQETSEEVGRKAEDADKYRAFSQAVANDMLNAMETGEKPYKSIKDIRAKAKSLGIEVDDEGRTDILLQELVEDGLVSAARQYVNTYVIQQMLAGKKAEDVRKSRDLFNDIVKLYDLQPSISQRSSNRIKMGQYSTPLPMSFIADTFAFKEGMEDVLEPTAGNGMMVFAVPEFTIHANELDKTRLDNLNAQKFKEVTDQDATQPFDGRDYDAIIANPPFGSAEAKDYDGKKISGLAEQIALNALSKMKDNGRAAIIIGGNMEYGDNGAIKNDKAFFTYLYDHYNVKGVIDMDGKLFSKQGTTWATRMILIDGRRSEEERAQSKVYPPVKDKAPKKATTFEELFDIAEEIRNDNKKTNGNEVLRTSTGIALPDNNEASGNTDRSGRDRQSRQNESDGGRSESRGSNRGGTQTVTEGTPQRGRRGSVGVQQPGIPGLFDSQESAPEPQPQTGGNREGGSSVNNGRNGSADVQGSGTADSGVGLNTPENPKETPKSDIKQAPEPQKPKVEEKRELETEKLSYRPHNTAYSLESVAPAAMVEAMDNMLSKIEEEEGNIDKFVTKELGYDSVEDMHNALAAEQVDSVAMAIYQMKQGQGMIIGDQTGVGKGRQMAALIRWACRQGKKPVFITQKADLFSDIYRDLVDIGSGELNPFIFNSDGAMVDNNGVTVHKPLPAKTQAQVFDGKELPDNYDFAVLTYSQVNTGDRISQEEAGTAAKERGERGVKKSKKINAGKATPKATFLRAIAKDNYMFLDESHTAAGKSNTGAYFQSILKDAKAVTFASATFAKRPDTMPMYAIRTAMAQAKVKTDELIKIIENGGVTLQEIMSRALTQAGQMVRRERDMSDVETDWKTVDDPETVKKARDNYDSTIEAFNAIIDFQKTWVAGYLNRLSKDLADVAASAGMRQGTEDLGISNVPFASKTYNYTKQLMLALKVDAIVDEVVKEIEAGRHPVIALENTMGSMLDDYAPGDALEETTFAASLLKGLKGVLRYTITDENGDKVQQELTPEQLGPDGAEAYHEVEDIIRNSTSGIFISPLDAIIEKLNQKGYKVGELTGRQQYVEFDDKTGEYIVRRRTDRDKKKMQREFNNGALDVLILNKSASTGISLHASEKFSDQRQRTMIIAQPLADINDYMQMIGRIDRTGQVHRGYYINLGLPVPAEGRFLMMLSTKLKSLNANTTTSQESESNDVEAPDLLNKYGSRVVIEYLRDNPDVYLKMGEPLKKEKGKVQVGELDSYEAQEDDARKITGYVALLPTNEQDDFYNDVVRRYNDLIKYLNDTGSNDLKISVLPLRARTIEKQVSSEGSDPKGDNPFAGHAYVEWVDMDVLKKPMKAAEVGKVIEQLNPEGDKTVSNILDTVEKETQAKLDKEDERYEAAQKRAEEDIEAKAETINKQEKRSPEQKREAIDRYSADRRKAVEESHQNMVNKIDANHDRLERYLKMFRVGDSVLVPDDLTTDTFMGASNGIFCGFKAKEEGVTPSTTLAVFCTLDGRRKIEVKLSDWNALVRIERMTDDNWDAAHRVTLSNWDEQIPSETRKHGYIMTGNILQAFSDAGQEGRVPGQLITYTDIDGNVHDGILMNQHWEPSQLKGSTVDIKARKEAIENLANGDRFVSADGNVVIDRWYRYYTLSVPKSKKLGGQYYENDRLLDLVDGRNFYPSRGQLKADIEPENIGKVVDVLSDLGVQMPSETTVHFDNETEMGQAAASGRRYDQSSYMDLIDNEENFTDTSYPEIRRAESAVLTYGKKTKKDEVRFVFTADNFYLYTQKQYGDIKLLTQLDIEKDYDVINYLLNKYGKGNSRFEGSTTLRTGRSFDDLVGELRSSKDGRNWSVPDDKGGQRRNDQTDSLDIRQQSKRHGSDAVVREISQRRERLQRNRIRKHVEKLLDKLGTKSRTTVYHSLNELPKADREYIERAHKQGRKVRGWYENGQIYLFLPDIDSEYQAEKTIWHETVAHHGLRELIGAENLNKLLKQLWIEHRDGEMGKWVTERMTKNGWRLNEAVEEYLAREAEKNPFKEPGIWQRLKWMLADVLHKMGFATDPTISDIQYLFWVSQNQLRENDPMGVVKQQAFLYNLERQAANTPYINMNAARPEDIENPNAEGAYEDGTRYSQETDEEVIERLDKEPKIKAYRAMQEIDGKLYPPMAAKQGGKLVNPIELGKWEKADEHPEMADENGKFKLDKGNGKSLKAAYNPYIHTSTTMLNDQFSEAQNRPNLVVVEVEVPESELTSGYKAEKAKDAVGKLEWKAGIIQGQLSGTREVILSRWDKPVRIVPTEEVAQHIADMIKGKVEVMPTNVVTPQQRAELEKLGVKFVETDNRGLIKDGENAGKSYSSVYGKKSGRRFDEDIDDPMEASAKALYNQRLNRVETVFTEAYQDAMISLKTAQNAIAGDKEIPDSQNAYMAENLMHGKNKNEQDLFNRNYRDPIINTINKIMNLTGMNWGDVDRYVYTKSGLERNREFFVRDWLEAERNKVIHKYEDLNPSEQDIYDSMAATIEQMFDDGDIETEEEKNKKLEQALQKAHLKYVDEVEMGWQRVKHGNYAELRQGNITFPDYLAAMDDYIFNNMDADYIPSEHDYSGFRAMFGDENGVYDEAVIIDELMNTEDQIEQENVDELWKEINAATRYGLERYREAGMRTDGQIDRVESMFHFYVPMRGFKEDMGEDMYQYFTGKGKEKSYLGGLLKHAKGRGSEANYPISTIFAMTYKAINDCNQNLVNQKLYRLCQANPNDLIILSDSWAKLNETTGEWEEVGPDIPEDADEEEVRQATLAWEDEMNQLANENKARKIKGREMFDYKPMDKKKQSEHIVDVRINGQPRKMIVTGNPRMAQALNGQLRFERGHNVFSKWNAAIKNVMASLFTSYSPTFALRNMFRDWTHFRTMLGVREGQGYAQQANKYYRQSLFKMVGLFRKYRNGTLDESKEMERDFKDFMDNGGITGFVQMMKIDDIQKEMEKLYKQQKEGKPIKLNNKVWDWTLGAIEAINEGIENNARFATFRTSRHYANRTKARSAYDAKEITVNFNKKGAGGKTAGFKSENKVVEDAAKAFGVTSQILGEGRIFFNATVQAIATTFKNFQNADGSLNKPYIAKWAAKYALPPFMFGLMLPYINKALAAAFGGDDDDDPYANLPEWTRRKNICIYAGNWKGHDYFITIPVGQELAAFLSLGDMAAGMTYAPDLKPVDRSIDEELLGVMNTFSPIDVDTKITKGGITEDPVDEVIGRTFSVLAPMVAVQQNLGWTGRPIYREDTYPTDKYNPEYQMVYNGTNPVLVGASKLANDLSGGDDVTRGKVQVNPAIVQYLWEQYTGGPGKVFSNTISIGKDAKDILTGNDNDFNIRKVEGLKAFVQQGDDRTQYYRTQAKYRKYKEDSNKLYDAVRGYQKVADDDPTAKMKLERIQKGEDYVRMQIFREADKNISKLNKAANKAEGKERKELRRQYNQAIKEVVDELDKVGEIGKEKD